ncbi:ARPP-1 family domain-containing protein [Alkaliphilus sp. B6464]|uniref:ARPP-1 family domain-containing protein n=1 Tax=Alkaliphilus sp. B6464 TaxID=2731219 RepID=UPI001BA75F4D|nr:DUF6569 family protein [Alkaliphilus sp. B6464]QUH21741.1 hypothetical protein HYG84_17550 [Alkaliphilus sp. B6464]
MLKQVLDFKIGTKQTSGVMSVYPLISEDRTDALASFEDIKFNGTTSYGTMVFSNNSEKPFIIPTGYSIITKQLAQDHALPFATLIKGNDNHRDINTACCIQQTQCGFIDGDKLKENFSILPLFIRKGHFDKYFRVNNSQLNMNNFDDFSRLWTIISSFQKGLVKESYGNIVLFFNKFMDKLTQFNAEFEVVEGQIGAVVMLNDKIVGIEVAPTHEYWKKIWNSLIRDCYGSEVIRLTMNNIVKEFEKSRELKLDLENCLTIKDIEKAIQNHENQNKDSLMKSLEKVLFSQFVYLSQKNRFVVANSDDNVSYAAFKASDKRAYGEAYVDKDGKLLYLSMLM